MARSVVEICNLALMRIGVSIPIAALDEGSNESRVLSTIYRPTLERVLAEMPWPFAMRYINLQDVGSPPAGWAYRYRYPTDCLKALRLVIDVTDKVSRYPFQIIADPDNDALAICSNIPGAVLEYTGLSLVVPAFPAPFVNALAWALASEIAVPLSANAALGKSAGEQYIAALHDAYAHSLNEGHDGGMPVSALESARS